jgi:hypothetical protein
MHPIDRVILEHGQEGFQPVTPLKGQIPSGTLYRHVRRLVAIGWLEKQGPLYRTTAAGQRQLAAAIGPRSWAALELAYPPLALVPTPTHRAVVELILAAVVARQHETRPDRQPYFVAVGGTLHWKTSLGILVCHVLGLDPTLHIIDCGTETGKSVAIRRGSTGAPVFERQLLQAPFVTFDEFLTASPEVRAALGLFLGGRLVVAFENEQLTVRPVPLLTLNPRPKATLEQQIGLSAPQIRRAILVNLDAVAMPDLAVSGERALEAARAHAPLDIGPPAVDCRAFHDPIVNVTRAILAPDAHGRVDVEIVVNLATGMTAFLADPAEAIAQVGYDLGLLAETLGWTRPGWIQAVTTFSLTPRNKASVTNSPAKALAPVMPSAQLQEGPAGMAEEAPPDTLSLEVREPVRRKGGIPDVTLSEATRMRLVWFAHETDRDVDGAIDLLLYFYLEQRANAQSIETIERSLVLARELELAEIEADTLRDYLADRQLLAAYNCSFSDLPQALQVLDLLGQLPIEWDWDLATAAMQSVADIMQAGIPASQIGAFVARHRRLEAVGFHETAEVLAAALSEAGAVGDQRGAVIQSLVEHATADVDREQTEAAAIELQAHVAGLETRQTQLERTIAALEQRRETLRQDIAATQETVAQVEAERAVKAGELDVLAGLKALLLTKTAKTDAFFEELRKLDRWRTIGGAPDDVIGVGHVKDLRAKLLALLQDMLLQAGGGKP